MLHCLPPVGYVRVPLCYENMLCTYLKALRSHVIVCKTTRTTSMSIITHYRPHVSLLSPSIFDDQQNCNQKEQTTQNTTQQ